MFECITPLFNPAPLSKEILESMRDLTANEQNVRYHSLSDGVISGCELYEKDMEIGVTSGIVKFEGRIYILSSFSGVKYKATDSWTVLKIRFGNEELSRDFSAYRGSLVLDDSTHILPNELELGRFKLKRGSQLRVNYVDFHDMQTEYDTVHLLHVPFAGIGEHTLCPVILMHFAREAYAYAKDAVNIAFCTSCLSSNGIMSRESIIKYISKNDRYNYPNDNHGLYVNLADILADLKGITQHSDRVQRDELLLL